MIWVGIGVTVIAGIVGTMFVVGTRRVDVHDLGSVSEHWVAEHRVDVA